MLADPSLPDPVPGNLPQDDAPSRAWRFPLRFGLSPRILLLTMAFVMLAEILIYWPSVANFRQNWLSDRISAAQIAVLVLEGSGAQGLPEGVESRLLSGVGAQAIAARVGGARRLLSRDAMPPEIGRTIDMREMSWPLLIGDAFDAMVNPVRMPIRVIGDAMGSADFVEIILDESPLRAAMLAFSRNILGLSLLISCITALLVYLALRWIIVRPVQRLAYNIMDFEAEPENPLRIIVPSGRSDEIGDAESALARMERTLAKELRQKKHLAELGLAVSKINHDLRNMLAAAQLMSDRLSDSIDPKVKHFAPKLIATLARAIRFCQSTLVYGRAAETAPVVHRLNLQGLVSDVAEMVGVSGPGPVLLENRVPPKLICHADPDHLFRILMNIVRNAVDVLTQSGAGDSAPRLIVEAWPQDTNGRRAVVIRINDNGPGVPAMAKANLFEAFRGSARPGGTGLGLAIARELVSLQGGSIALEDASSDAPLSGASFRIVLPQP